MTTHPPERYLTPLLADTWNSCGHPKLATDFVCGTCNPAEPAASAHTMTEPLPPADLAGTYVISTGRIDVQGTWAVAIDAVHDAALALLATQQAEDHAQTLLGNWRATVLTEELLSGRINGSNDRVRKGQEETFLASRLDHLDLLDALHQATAARKRAEVELEYARLRERFWRVQNQATTVAT